MKEYKVFTKIDGKFSVWKTSAMCVEDARKALLAEMIATRARHGAVLALVPKEQG